MSVLSEQEFWDSINNCSYDNFYKYTFWATSADIIIFNYTKIKIEEDRDYYVDYLYQFYLTLKNEPLLRKGYTKYCCIDYLLIKKVMKDISDNKIEGKERFFERSGKTNHKPKRGYFSLLFSEKEQFLFLEDKFFYLYSDKYLKDAYRYNYEKMNNWAKDKHKLSDQDVFWLFQKHYKMILFRMSFHSSDIFDSSDNPSPVDIFLKNLPFYFILATIASLFIGALYALYDFGIIKP